MPELPEVETVRRKLEKKLINKTIKEIEIIYPGIFSEDNIEFVKENIKNKKIQAMKRRGKWLIFELEDFFLLSHLRMEGKYLYRKLGDELGKHEHVIIRFDDDFELRYQDVRKFGKMHLIKKDGLENDPNIKKLGLEPWDEKLDKDYLLKIYRRKKLPIKTVLLDQTIITGIGNIYADEILFLSKINPHKQAYLLNAYECERIIKNTKIILEKAINEGGTTIRSYTSEEGVSGLFQQELYVHTKKDEPCSICKTIIKKDKIGGRGTYYCENCQKD